MAVAFVQLEVPHLHVIRERQGCFQVIRSLTKLAGHHSSEFREGRPRDLQGRSGEGRTCSAPLIPGGRIKNKRANSSVRCSLRASASGVTRCEAKIAQNRGRTAPRFPSRPLAAVRGGLPLTCHGYSRGGARTPRHRYGAVGRALAAQFGARPLIRLPLTWREAVGERG